MEFMLLSNGKAEEFPGLLGYARDQIKAMIARNNVTELLFIHYAFIRGDVEQRAADLEESLGVKCVPISHFDDPVAAVQNAQGIIVSGGNTWHLNQKLHELNLVVPIQRAVRERNVPYIGWSAGCIIATPSIRTTNDMPVSSAAVFPALGLFPVQMNAHYLDAKISGFMGETRDERLAEFCLINPTEYVIGLREASLIEVSGDKLSYFSARGESYKIFRHGMEPTEHTDVAAMAALTPFQPA